MPRGIPKTDNSEGLVFFGAVDRRGKKQSGEIASQLPAWYFDEAIDELKESIASIERNLERGVTPANSVPTARARLVQEKKRLEEIESSRPRPNTKQKQWLVQKAKELEAEIAPSMFTRDQMRTGDASPHEELRRSKMPGMCRIDPELARLCGIRIPKGGKVSRDEAIRALKPINKLLGRPTDAEYLRVDERTFRTQRVTPFTGYNEQVPRLDDIEDYADGREAASEGTA